MKSAVFIVAAFVGAVAGGEGRGHVFERASDEETTHVVIRPSLDGVAPDSTDPLIQAAVDEDLERFERLLLEGADVNGFDQITPIYAVLEYVRNSRKRHSILRRLLKAGAQPDTRTLDGTTALMLAAYNGDMRASQILVEHGADPYAQNKLQLNSIEIAYNRGHGELGKLLQELVGERDPNRGT